MSRALRGLLKCSAMYSGVCSAPKTREKQPRFSLEKYERWEYCVSAVHFHRGRRREGGGGGSQRRSRVVGEQPCLDGASVGVTVSDWAWPEDVVGRSHR